MVTAHSPFRIFREAASLVQIEYWTAVRALIDKILNIRRRRAYTHIVSLGDNCRPSYQIARHFKFRKSYPFDGWITPLDSAALYIEKLDEDLYDPAGLQELAVNGEIVTIVNTKFQIRLFHDFKRGGAVENVLPDWKSGIKCEKPYRTSCPQVAIAKPRVQQRFVCPAFRLGLQSASARHTADATASDRTIAPSVAQAV